MFLDRYLKPVNLKKVKALFSFLAQWHGTSRHRDTIAKATDLLKSKLLSNSFYISLWQLESNKNFLYLQQEGIRVKDNSFEDRSQLHYGFKMSDKSWTRNSRQETRTS